MAAQATGTTIVMYRPAVPGGLLFLYLGPMDFQKLCNEVAAEYGIEVESLESGSFTVPEWQVLYPLYEKYLQTENEEDMMAYLKQKAKFIADRRN